MPCPEGRRGRIQSCVLINDVLQHICVKFILPEGCILKITFIFADAMHAKHECRTPNSILRISLTFN